MNLERLLLALGAAALAWPGTAQSAAAPATRPERRVVVAIEGPAERYAEALRRAVVPATVPIVVLPLRGLAAELRGDPTPTLVLTTLFAAHELAREGTLRAWPKALVECLPASHRAPEAHALVPWLDPYVLAQAAGAGEHALLPRSWSALAHEPGLDGRIAAPEPGSSPELWVGWIQDRLAAGEGEDQAFLWLGSLDARVREYVAGEEEVVRLVANGEASVGIARASLVRPHPRLALRVLDTLRPARGLALVQSGVPHPGPGALLERILDPGVLQQVADELYLVAAPLPGVAGPAWAGPGVAWRDARPADPERAQVDAWFVRWREYIRGRGARLEWVSLAFDAAFAALFVAFLVFVHRHLRRSEEREAHGRA